MFATMTSTPYPQSSPPSKTVKVLIKGRVQGVWFRRWTVDNARLLGLSGWVRNRRDGSVEAVFSGKSDKVDEMAERRCRIGPSGATVTAIVATPIDELPDPGFHLKYDD